MIGEQRPDPDALLARMQAEEARQARGKLKVFFGAAAGVGKTYAMLAAARLKRAEGVDVVAGYVETHGRKETEALLAGLEILPPRWIEYRGTRLREFDLDAALARHPALILVDELAHSNAPGSRHAKRWQDVEELLDAGVDVYTAVNVQHLESLNDVVAQITGVVVRETVPDSILEEADDVELVDLPPDELLQRLREGKVYVARQAERATQSFFRKGNLIALRELALRRTADRVDAQMQIYRRDHAIPRTWPTAERIMVCISPNPLSARLVRAGRRMAAGLHAEWIAVYVETPALADLPEAAHARVVQALRLAEQLGAEAVTLTGHRISDQLLAYARARNVTKIIVGKPAHPRWQELLFGSVVDALVRDSGEIDLYVIAGDRDEPRSPPVRTLRRTISWPSYVLSAAVVAACTAFSSFLVKSFAPSNLIMIYLLGIVFVATRWGRGPSILCSVLSVAAFDFFFVPPQFTFAVTDTQYGIVFAGMLIVGLVISTLTTRMSQQAQAATRRERAMAALYSMSRELAGSRGMETLLAVAVRHLHDVFDSQVVILMPGEVEPLEIRAEKPRDFLLDAKERSVAEWVYDHGQVAGLATDTLPASRAMYLPLRAARGTIGVVGILPPQPQALTEPERLRLLEAFVNQIALALDRAHLADEVVRAQVQSESEHLRNSLLTSIARELRAPLAALTRASSRLVSGDWHTPADRHALDESISGQVTQLNQMIGTLLEATNVEARSLHLHREPCQLTDIIQAALAQMTDRLRDRPVAVNVSDDLPPMQVDAILLQQVLLNLLDHAVRYTPPHSPIDLSARQAGSEVIVEVADHGEGIQPSDEERIFQDSHRSPAGRSAGAGPSLAICRAIIEAHGGRIWAENRREGGTRFLFTLPLDGQQIISPDGADTTIAAPAATEASGE